MKATNHDILDLVAATVSDICPEGKAPCVYLNDDNIIIGDKPVSITAIRATKDNVKGFINLIKNAI